MQLRTLLRSATRRSGVTSRTDSRASFYLDVVRSWCALTVLINHWRNLTLVEWSSVRGAGIFVKLLYFVTDSGHQAVMGFFVISGYLVGGSVVRTERAGTWSWSPYLVARLTRLLIVLWPALILGGTLDWLGVHAFGAAPVYLGAPAAGSLKAPTATHLHASVAIGNAFFLQEILVPTFGSNVALWSLSCEFWYYLTFPLLVMTMSSRGTSDRVVAAAAFVMIIFFVGREIRSYYPIWLAGALVAAVRRPRIARRTADVLSICALMCTCAALILNRLRLLRDETDDYIIGASFAVLIYFLTKPDGFRKRGGIFDSCIDFMSRSSYTLYLVHLPALVFITAATHAAGRWTPSTGHLARGFAILAGVYGYAIVVFFLFEAQTARVRALLGRVFA